MKHDAEERHSKEKKSKSFQNIEAELLAFLIEKESKN